MDDNKFLKLVLGVFTLSALVGAAAFLLGVLHAGAQLLSSAVLLTLQIFLVIVAILVSIALCVLCWWLVGWAIAGVTKRFAELEKRYDEQFKRLKAKRPAWVATLLFITEGVMILVDKSFQGHETETLIVSFSLLIGFWVANHLMTCEERWKSIAGLALWFAVLVSFPVSIAIDRDLGFMQFLAFLWSFDPTVKIFFIVAFLCLLVVPTLTRRAGAEVD